MGDTVSVLSGAGPNCFDMKSNAPATSSASGSSRSLGLGGVGASVVVDIMSGRRRPVRGGPANGGGIADPFGSSGGSTLRFPYTSIVVPPRFIVTLSYSPRLKPANRTGPLVRRWVTRVSPSVRSSITSPVETRFKCFG